MQASDSQGTKNRKRALTLVLLTSITIASAFFIDNSPTVDVDRNIFKVSDTESVDRVVLEQSGKKIELRFNGATWKVNDTYDADQNLIKVVMATLRQAEVKRKIANASVDSLSAALNTGGVTVSVFAGDQLVESFVAGGNKVKTQSFFKDKRTDEVYLVNIPGYRVYVSGIFELKESGWREKIVFDFNWRNFQSLEAKFTDSPGNNFKISPQKGVFAVEGVATDTTKLSQFMDGVFSLVVEEYVESSQLADSLNQVKPFLDLLIRDVAKNEYSLKIFRESSAGRVPALLNGKEAVFINAQRLRPIIKPKSYFVLH
jgi:hypothetical protein